MSGADEYFDALETRDPSQREEQLMTELSAQLAHAKTNAPHYAEAFADLLGPDWTPAMQAAWDDFTREVGQLRCARLPAR